MVSLLTVNIVTYNHEHFIDECIQSVLNQKTSFDFIINIVDDHSTDATPEILKQYAVKYPTQIVLTLNKSNKGMVKNITESLLSLHTKYVAILEGDDFYIDHNKLQHQIDVLEERDDLSFTFTNGKIVSDGKNSDDFYPDGYFESEVITHEGFIMNDYTILNTSKVYRRSSLPDKLPEWYFQTHLWDWTLHFMQLEKGNAMFINIPGTGFRSHESSFIKSLKSRDNITNGLFTIKQLNHRYSGKFRKQLGSPWKLHYNISIIEFKDKNYTKWLKHFTKSLFLKPDYILKNARNYLYLLRN